MARTLTLDAAAIAATRLMVATPIYAGAAPAYVRALLALAMEAKDIGLAIDFVFTRYQPDISRARNNLTHIFLRSDFTHLLFIDDDVDFAAADIFSILAAMVGRADCAILGAPVPRRVIAWGQVARAAELGLGRENPANLAKYGGSFALRFADPAAQFRIDELVELDKLGTGLMLIRRDVITRLVERHSELCYVTNAEERAAYGLDDQVCGLFNGAIDPETRMLEACDYSFCRRARDAGFSIFLAPWVATAQSGPATFDAKLSDLARLAG